MGFNACVMKSDYPEGKYALFLMKTATREKMYIPFRWKRDHFPTVDEALKQVKMSSQDRPCGNTPPISRL